MSDAAETLNSGSNADTCTDYGPNDGPLVCVSTAANQHTGDLDAGRVSKRFTLDVPQRTRVEPKQLTAS